MTKLIPFNWLPASWGLRGNAYEEAKAYYELEGFDLEMRIAEISLTGADLQKAEANIRKDYGIIDEYEWMKQHIIADTAGDETTQKVELIKLDIEKGLIDRRKGEKQIADLLQEPWVGIIEEGLDPDQGPNGFYFVFDWNEHWIEQLRAAGYEGNTEDDLMERWFADVCRNEVLQSAPVPFNSSVVYD